MFSKHRLEALSDAIFAIVMTLLILDLKVPTSESSGLWTALRGESHEWISFLVTFAISARYWILQHRLFDLLKTVHSRTVTTMFLFLGFITVLPFSTSLWGHHLAEPLALSLYFLNLTMIGLVMVVELEAARMGQNLHTDERLRSLRGKLYIMTGAMCGAAISCWILPLKYMGIATALIAVLAKKLQTSFVIPSKPVQAVGEE